MSFFANRFSAPVLGNRRLHFSRQAAGETLGYVCVSFIADSRYGQIGKSKVVRSLHGSINKFDLLVGRESADPQY